MFRLKILLYLLWAGKCLSMRERKLLPILVDTDALNGGLNQIIDLDLERLVGGF